MDESLEFLKLLDFPEEEIPVLLPVWKRACAVLHLSEQDLRFAREEWLPQYWDLHLRGVRKCIAAYIRELIEVTKLSDYKACGDKIIYYNMPCHPPCIYAHKRSGGKRIHICYPDYIIATVFSAFFHKTASNRGNGPCASPLCHQCEMNQFKVNKEFRDLLPEPDVLWNWGLYCNEGHKIEELAAETEDRDWFCVLTTMPPDATPGMDEREDQRRVEYLVAELRDAQKRIGERTGIPVSDGDLIDATEEYLAYQMKIEELAYLVSKAACQPIGGNDMAIFQAPAQIAFGTGLKWLSEALDTLLEEVKARIAEGIGPLPADAPRLACHFVPFSVPWINRAFMDNGVNLSVNTFFALASEQQHYFDRNDIYRSAARQWLCNPSAVGMLNEADLVCEILQRYPVDGVLYGFFDFSCWIGSLKKTLIKIVEARTGIPHYYFESEFWNDEQYSLDDRIARIRSIAYRVKINHLLGGWKHGTKKDIERQDTDYRGSATPD